MDNESKHQELVNACLPPNTPIVRDNMELAVRAIVTFHHNYARGYPDHKTPIQGTILVFVPSKPEIIEIVEILKNSMRRGFTPNLYPYGFHSDTLVTLTYVSIEHQLADPLTKPTTMLVKSIIFPNWGLVRFCP